MQLKFITYRFLSQYKPSMVDTLSWDILHIQSGHKKNFANMSPYYLYHLVKQNSISNVGILKHGLENTTIIKVSLMVTTTKFWKFQVATLIFSHHEMIFTVKKHWNSTCGTRNGSLMQMQRKTVLTTKEPT